MIHPLSIYLMPTVSVEIGKGIEKMKETLSLLASSQSTMGDPSVHS